MQSTLLQIVVKVGLVQVENNPHQELAENLATIFMADNGAHIKTDITAQYDPFMRAVNGHRVVTCCKISYSYSTIMKLIDSGVINSRNFRQDAFNAFKWIIDCRQQFDTFRIQEVNQMAQIFDSAFSLSIILVGSDLDQMVKEVKNINYKKFSSEFDCELDELLTNKQ